MAYSYKYARPALSVDIVVFALGQDELQVMLIQRDADPFAGSWALPGGFVEIDETVDAAAVRELHEETGMDNIFLEQLFTFSEVDRDPRERVVTVAHYALVNPQAHTVLAGSDARSATWFGMSDLPKLAFDHKHILDVALQRLRGKVRYQPIGFELLPELFTLRQLQHLYEIILGRTLDKRNFRKKILSMGILRETKEVEQGVAHRAAQLYRFSQRTYERLTKQGFVFEV